MLKKTLGILCIGLLLISGACVQYEEKNDLSQVKSSALVSVRFNPGIVRMSNEEFFALLSKFHSFQVEQTQ